MNEEKVFSDSSMRLIRVFLEEEAKEYPYRNCQDFDELYKEYDKKIPYELLTLNDEGKLWVSSLLQIILTTIRETVTEGADKYSFVSHGNAGGVVSELILDGSGRFYNWKKGTVVISLCTCGILSHWGGVILPQNYNEKDV